jgi:polyphosphate kinase
VQVTDATAQAELRRAFELSLRPNVRAFDLDSEGRWHRRMPIGDETLDDPQELLLRRAFGRPE